MSLFTVRAGHRALEVIRDGGLEQSSVKTIAGAAGGLNGLFWLDLTGFFLVHFLKNGMIHFSWWDLP